MRHLALAVLAVGCRHGFDVVADGGRDADASHYVVAPGWSISVLVDLSGVVPYRPNDYMDGTNEVLDNAPYAVAALYAPFVGELAVAAGRSVIEVRPDATTAVHDYRPAVPDTTGPDSIYRLTFGSPPDVGPALWLAAPSQLAGDGLYQVSPTWQLTRDNSHNNVAGVGFDATGAFDSRPLPTIYYTDMSGLWRRDSATTRTLIVAGADDLDGVAVTATALFTAHTPATGPNDIYRIFATTHATQTVATASTYAVAEAGPLASTSIAAIRDGVALVIYANDGTSVVGAASTDPAWKWIYASAPQPPHRLAGSYVVLESNRTLNRDRLLLVTP